MYTLDLKTQVVATRKHNFLAVRTIKLFVTSIKITHQIRYQLPQINISHTIKFNIIIEGPAINRSAGCAGQNDRKQNGRLLNTWSTMPSSITELKDVWMKP